MKKIQQLLSKEIGKNSSLISCLDELKKRIQNGNTPMALTAAEKQEQVDAINTVIAFVAFNNDILNNYMQNEEE